MRATSAAEQGGVPDAVFRDLVLQATDLAVFLLDEHGVITTWNPGAQRIKGWPAEETVGRHFSMLYLEEDARRGAPDRHLREAAAGTRTVFQGWRQRRDGSRFFAEVVITPLRDADGRVFAYGKVTRDLTGQMAALTALQDSEETFRLLVTEVRDHAMVMLDPEGVVTTWNQGAERITGYPAEEIVGRHVSTFYTPTDAEAGAPMQHLQLAAASGRTSYEGWRVRKDGGRFWAEVSVNALRDEDGRLRGFAKVTRDLSERRLAQQEVTHLIEHDALTGLPNRALLLDRLSRELPRCEVDGGSLGVLFVDLDRFKAVNAAFGQAVGDKVLKTIAARLSEEVSEDGVVARWGADEFVVLMPQLSGREHALDVVTRLRAALTPPVVHRSDELLVTASIGVALSSPDDRPPAEQLLQEADAAMRQAKHQGTAHHSVFDEALRHAAARRGAVESLLERAVAQERVVLHYQPLVDLRTRRLLGAEALLRLRDDDGGLLRPDEFLDVAEDTDLLVCVEHEVLRLAAAQAARWRADGHDLSVSVNVCARQLSAASEFEKVVARTLEAAALPPEALVCEVTEHSLLDTGAHTLGVLERMRDNGVHFSIDDFGTGYSSLTYLTTLPVQELKIDRSFVLRLDSDPRALAVVRAATVLAGDLGLRSVAEGVEDEGLHRRVLELGVDRGQGYLYGRPVPAEDFAVHLRPG